jgi:hypothetical protein
MTILFRAYLRQKISEAIWTKIYLGEDPDLEVGSRMKVGSGFGAGQISSGSATL